ncbi:hypothetical protein GUJ93_ZPchr0013g38031 [Zizania palustris]|uniref:Uncharacterized protein n=1 Tax=Zizania palustris TaxID=103762 RepID=A0A8J5WUC2_ZIZPA|nr:hypothetical protein GUJ93_ZPchr0013g38031 [Zizania palustris]
MAVSASAASTLPLLSLHRASENPNPTSLSFPSSLRASPLRSRVAASASAAPPAETISDDQVGDAPEATEGTGIPIPSSIGDDGEQLAPKQKIRIKLRSYWVPLIEDSCKRSWKLQKQPMRRLWVQFLCQPSEEFTVCSILLTCTKTQGSISRSERTSD